MAIVTGEGRTADMSEDCLTLNIWTPAKKASDKLAVMFWIHGGALVSGSSSNGFYNGAGLANHGVVVVTINYRLGALGFLSHPALTAESQTGLIFGFAKARSAVRILRLLARVAARCRENASVMAPAPN